MAKAPKNGKDGIDAWTNSGHGLKAKPAISKKEAEAINRAVDKRMGKKK